MSDLKTAERLNTVQAHAPTMEQSRAKARLTLKLRERADTTDMACLTSAELVELSGNSRILKWLQDPAFAVWLADKDTYVHNAIALRELAVQKLGEILTADYESKILTAKDQIKAIELLFNLTGSFPAKQREVRFLDKDLDSMPPDVVQAETARLREQLAQKQLPSS